MQRQRGDRRHRLMIRAGHPSAQAFGAFLFAFAVALFFETARHSLSRGIPPGHVFVGWTAYDLPSYYANARELYENGNGLFYGNPYSPASNSPRIYSHLLISLMGLLYRIGVGFHVQEFLWRSFGAAGAFAFLWLIIREVTDPGFWRKWIVYVAGLGGGITGALALVAALGNTGSSEGAVITTYGERVWAAHVFLEENWGRCMVNLFRNLTFSMECVYHLLFFGAVLAAFRRHWSTLLLLMFITWWTHPFTGLQLGSILVIWAALEYFLSLRSHQFQPVPRRVVLSLLFIQLGFLAYYGPWLNRFPEHRSLVEIWKSEKTVKLLSAPVSYMIPAYGPLIAGFAWLLSSAGRGALRTSPVHRLLLVWAGTTLLLIHHDELPFVRNPVQPLHFTRGYLYVVLAVWTGLWLSHLETELRARPVLIRAVAFIVSVVLILDSGVYFARFFLGKSAQRQSIISIPRPMAAAFQRLSEIQGQKLVLTLEANPSWGMGYLLNTETSHRSFIGHVANTPFLTERTLLLREWVTSPSMEMLNSLHVDMIIAQRQYLLEWNLPATASSETYLGNILGNEWSKETIGEGVDGYICWMRRLQPPSARSKRLVSAGGLE